MQEEGGMVLKRVSTIIPLGNFTRRSTAKEFESKRRKLSEPGPMKNRNSWIGNTEVDGLDECKVLAQGSRMEYSMFNVIWMSFISFGIGVFVGCIVFFLQYVNIVLKYALQKQVLLYSVMVVVSALLQELANYSCCLSDHPLVFLCNVFCKQRA